MIDDVYKLRMLPASQLQRKYLYCLMKCAPQFLGFPTISYLHPAITTIHKLKWNDIT